MTDPAAGHPPARRTGRRLFTWHGAGARSGWPARLVAVALGALVATTGGAGEPVDVDGARDPAVLPRFPGATIFEFTVREREVAAFAAEGGRLLSVEGHYTLVRYRYPAGSACRSVLDRYEAESGKAGLRVAKGTRLPEEAARGLGGAPVEGWVSAVGEGARGGTVHVMATCSAGGLSPSGAVLIVESQPLVLRGRGTGRPAFDTAPSPPGTAGPPRETAEAVVRCPRKASVQVGPVSPVELGDDRGEGEGAARWDASFAPVMQVRQFTLSGSEAVDGRVSCRYTGEAEGPSLTLTRTLAAGRACAPGPVPGEFRCVKP